MPAAALSADASHLLELWFMQGREVSFCYPPHREACRELVAEGLARMVVDRYVTTITFTAAGRALGTLIHGDVR